MLLPVEVSDLHEKPGVTAIKKFFKQAFQSHTFPGVKVLSAMCNEEAKVSYKTFSLRTKCDGFAEISPYFRTAKISVVVIESIALFLA